MTHPQPLKPLLGDTTGPLLQRVGTSRLIAALASVAALLLTFAILSSEMLEGETRTFDMAILRTAQAWRAAHPWLAEVARDFSGVGSTAALTLFVLLTVGYLLVCSARRSAVLVAVSTLSGTACMRGFKALFGRARPDSSFAEFVVDGLSFPSGHSTMSAIVFITMGALVARTQPRPAQGVFVLLGAASLVLLVGLSRVTLGVHYATDVIGGWAFGTAWAIVWSLLAIKWNEAG